MTMPAAAWTPPMLVGPLRCSPDACRAAEWLMEEQIDGHRLLLDVTSWGVRAWSRDGRLLRLPAHLLSDALQLPAGYYDGALYVPGGRAADVRRVVHRASLRIRVFDLLRKQDAWLLDAPLAERRDTLALMLTAVLVEAAAIEQAPSLGAPSLAVVQAIWARGGKGAVLKRWASPYRPGVRSADWMKVTRAEDPRERSVSLGTF